MKTATAPLPPLRSVKVLDQLRERIRYLHYSLRTEQAYVHWVRAFIRFHGVRHPATLGSSEVEAFLSRWRTSARFRSPRIVRHWRPCCSSTARCCARICPPLQEIGRPRPSRRLPVVLTPDEVVRILGFLEGEHRLFAQLLYGTGMRISATGVKAEHLLAQLLCNCNWGQGSGFRSRHDHRAGGQGLHGSGLDVTREGTQPARAAVACTGMVAEGPPRAARRCLPDALERKYPRAGHSRRGSGFLRSTRIRPIHGAVSCVAITCMTRPFSAPSNVP